jgi:hypothetical protein
MNRTTTLMSQASPPDPLWRLAGGQALRLSAQPTARWLRVREGQLWVTADGRPGGPSPQDWWVQPGDSLRVPPGTPVLAEAWKGASFELLQEPCR